MLFNENVEKVLKEKINEDISEGKMIVLKSYVNTKERYKTDLIVFNNGIWEKDIQEIVDFLHELGIDKFIITDSSSGLMSTLHGFMKLGYKVEKQITIVEESFSGEYEKDGLVLSREVI